MISPQQYSRNVEKNVVVSPTGVNDSIFNDTNYLDLAPNSVFALIENLKWKEAIVALHKFPDEARQWVKKEDGARPGWRRLPLHEALIRNPSADIIQSLLDAYPDSVTQHDDYFRTPLHHAVIHNASSDVMTLILDADMKALDKKDFFDKLPKEYVTADEVLTIISQNRKCISLAAGKVRERLEASASYVHMILNSSQVQTSSAYTPTRQPYKSRAMESLLEEELAQARVEADVAYSERDMAMAEKEKMENQVKLLSSQLQEKNNIIEDMKGLSDRNRRLNDILKKLEAKNQSIVKKMSARDREIQEQIELRKQESETFQEQREKLMLTVEVLSMKLAEMNSSLDDSFAEEKSVESAVLREIIEDKPSFEEYRSSSEQRIESLEETVEVYKSAANDLQMRCIELEDRLEHNVTENHGRFLEEELQVSQEEIKLLRKSNANSTSRIQTLEELMRNYKTKNMNLELGFYNVTEQLIEKTKELYNLQS